MRLFPLRFPSNNPDSIETTLLKILPLKLSALFRAKAIPLFLCCNVLLTIPKSCTAKTSAAKPTSLLLPPIIQTRLSDGKQSAPHSYLSLGGSCF